MKAQNTGCLIAALVILSACFREDDEEAWLDESDETEEVDEMGLSAEEDSTPPIPLTSDVNDAALIDNEELAERICPHFVRHVPGEGVTLPDGIEDMAEGLEGWAPLEDRGDVVPYAACAPNGEVTYATVNCYGWFTVRLKSGSSNPTCYWSEATSNIGGSQQLCVWLVSSGLPYGLTCRTDSGGGWTVKSGAFSFGTAPKAAGSSSAGYACYAEP